MRYWGCWTKEKKLPPEPFDQTIVCGYLQNRTDPRCVGCGNNPDTEKYERLDMVYRKVSQSWAKRWGR